MDVTLFFTMSALNIVRKGGAEKIMLAGAPKTLPEFIKVMRHSNHRHFSPPQEQGKARTDPEKENDQDNRNAYDPVCQMSGGMLVKNGGPLLVKTDIQGSTRRWI
jgi:hypothetical protein